MHFSTQVRYTWFLKGDFLISKHFQTYLEIFFFFSVWPHGFSDPVKTERPILAQRYWNHILNIYLVFMSNFSIFFLGFIDLTSKIWVQRHRFNIMLRRIYAKFRLSSWEWNLETIKMEFEKFPRDGIFRVKNLSEK